MNIKPIETVYNGYRFRSRLEARWAVFFDALGVKYEYEPEGFEMDGIRYLPDFYLPKANRWIEIKGKRLTEIELNKCDAFCESKDKEGVKFSIFIGQPFDNIEGICPSDKNPGVCEKTLDMKKSVVVGVSGYSYHWKKYDVHGPNGELEHVDNDRVLFMENELCEKEVLTRFMPTIWMPISTMDGESKLRLIYAAIKARQARFEHGETP